MVVVAAAPTIDATNNAATTDDILRPVFITTTSRELQCIDYGRKS